MGEEHYRLAWSSVDGAGSDDTHIPDKDTAIQQANIAQAGAEVNGNPWGYTYRVRNAESSTVYNARTKEHYIG